MAERDRRGRRGGGGGGGGGGGVRGQGKGGGYIHEWEGGRVGDEKRRGVKGGKCERTSIYYYRGNSIMG